MSKMTFEVIPAIDLRNGRCVRLFQGDFRRERVFSDDPVSMALHWQEQGAPRLHIVDLDGAASGEPKNLPVVKGMLKAVHIPIQLGGGIRTLKVISHLLSIGVDRVILGTAAVTDPNLVRTAVKESPNSIVIGIDSRDGKIAVQGWIQDTLITHLVLIRKMTRVGVRRFIVTDISRDGTLTEPSYATIQKLAHRTKAAIIASGGVTSIEHLRRLRDLGIEGAIVGTALYTSALDYRAAVEALKEG